MERITSTWRDDHAMSEYHLERWVPPIRLLCFTLKGKWIRIASSVLYTVALSWSRHYRIPVQSESKES